MSTRRSPQISTRKEPQQSRSNELVAAVLRAAIQVFAREGAQRFTMARVAERAGVSVGSLYQYFPNKAAILFRLQSDEWRQTTDLMRDILEDASRSPFVRLRALVHAFVQSEWDEAAVRVALNDAAPLYRDAPEAHDARESSKASIEAFMREVLPDAPEAVRKLASALITTTLSTVGKDFSERLSTSAEIDVHAGALADMLCAYVESLATRQANKGPGRRAATRRRQ